MFILMKQKTIQLKMFVFIGFDGNTKLIDIFQFKGLHCCFAIFGDKLTGPYNFKE
jgi:hypothetical protein